MKNTRTTLCCTVFCLLTLAGAGTLWSDPPSRVGRLNYISGTVSYHPESVEDWGVATLNYPLTIGDSLWTDQDGKAEVHVGSTAIRLASSTEISFLNLDDKVIQIRLSMGSLNIRLRNLGQDEQIEVDTPDASLSLLRAGSYRMDVQQNGDTAVSVRSGEIEVTAGTKIFPLRRQETATITGTDSPTYEVTNAAPPDDWDQWCDARDLKEDHVESAQYVSPNEIDGVEDLDQYGSWNVDVSLGPVWVPTVTVVGWAPYRFGHWAWVDPWGWTWIDDTPWGFAPFHYGRWMYRNSVWAWVPGPRISRPVYAPALVVFVGGAGWHPGPAPGESVGWFPLGPREPYLPPYWTGHPRPQGIDIVHFNYVNRGIPGAVTVVPNGTFVGGGSTSQAALRLGGADLAGAPIRGAVAPLAPQRESVFGGFAAARGPAVAHPPAEILSRPVVSRLRPAPRVPSFASREQALRMHPGQPLFTGPAAGVPHRAPTPGAHPQANPTGPGYRPRVPGRQTPPMPSAQAGSDRERRYPQRAQGAPSTQPRQKPRQPVMQGATNGQPEVRRSPHTAPRGAGSDDELLKKKKQPMDQYPQQ